MLSERDRLHAFLAESVVAHLGVVVGDRPVVLPMAFAADLAGPDPGGSLYLHGSVAAGWLDRALGAPVCVTVTELDGLVLARSGFHHSMNYRSAVVIGTVRRVEDSSERRRALDLIIDQMMPGRAATLRPPTKKELAATAVLAVPLREASLKVREGGPVDDEQDLDAPVWAGHIPIRRVAGPPITAPDSRIRSAPHTSSLAARGGRPGGERPEDG